MVECLEHSFWSVKAFRNELLINGYIRKLDCSFHPNDIITILFNYYQIHIPSFTKHGYYFNPSTWKSSKTISLNQCITVTDKTAKILIEPSKLFKWCQSSSITLNNTKYSLQYNFSIKCIQNMEKNIHIGIMTDYKFEKTNRFHHSYSKDYNGCFNYNETYNVAYLMKICKDNKREMICFHANYYNSWNPYSTFPTSSTLKGTTSIPKKHINNDIISVNLNCKNWKVYFLYNNTIIHSIQIDCRWRHKRYKPIIWFQDLMQRQTQRFDVKYKVEAMKCEIIIPEKPKIMKNNVDIDKYIFSVDSTEYDYLNHNTFTSSKAVLGMLWRGYKLIYLRNMLNLTDVSNEIYYDEERECLWIIMETYQYFYEEYIDYLSYLLSKIQLFTNCYSKISLIISHYIIENYCDDYKMYKQNYVWVGDMIRSDLYYGKNFKLLDYLYKYCVSCGSEYAGSAMDDDGHGNVMFDHFMYGIATEEVPELNIKGYNLSKDEHHKGNLYGDTRYKIRKNKVDKQKISLSKKTKKRRSFLKHKRDKNSNYKSNKQFQKRYQLSLQY